MKHKNYYEILEISENATPSQIKRAYYSLAKEYHPDVNPKAAHLFCNINEAYETLIDPIKRKQYDLSLKDNTSTEEETVFTQTESDYYYTNAKYYQDIDNEPMLYILKDFNKYKLEKVWHAINNRNLFVLSFSVIGAFIICFSTIVNRMFKVFKKTIIPKKKFKWKSISFVIDCIKENRLWSYIGWFITLCIVTSLKVIKIIGKILFFIYDKILRPLFMPIAIILAALFWSNKDPRRYRHY